MALLATQLPPGGWRLLNTIHDRLGGSGRRTAATLIKRCGVSVEDLVEMSTWNAGLLIAVNADGDDMTMYADAAMGDELKEFYLQLTDRGTRWVRGTPANVVLRSIATTPQATWMGLHELLAMEHCDADVIRRLVEAGLVAVRHASGGELEDLTPVVFRYPRDFIVVLTPRGHELVT